MRDDDGARLACPDQIVVYDFAAKTADLPIWSDARETHADNPAPASAKEVEIGRKLGVSIAAELGKPIDAVGLTAVRTTDHPSPKEGEIVIVGSLASIDTGSGCERTDQGREPAPYGEGQGGQVDLDDVVGGMEKASSTSCSPYAQVHAQRAPWLAGDPDSNTAGARG